MRATSILTAACVLLTSSTLAREEPFTLDKPLDIQTTYKPTDCPEDSKSKAGKSIIYIIHHIYESIIGYPAFITIIILI